MDELNYAEHAAMFLDSDEDIISEEMLALWGGFSICSLREMQTLMDGTHYGRRSVPTHTEDGIPIRKIYVTNLPYKTTRSELFGFFAQYGFIKSCWLKNSDNQNVDTSPYAFVTFLEPADAHKALVAPSHERRLRGEQLRVSPADSWHQPGVDAEGRVQWPGRRTRPRRGDSAQGSSTTADNETAPSNSQSEPSDQEPEYGLMDILNHDCLAHVLSYLPLRDLIRTERVSKRWRDIVRDYYRSIRTFKTSGWDHSSVMLTTAVLRHLLLRLGPTLTTFHIDHHRSALNDRTAHTIGKFCPNLERLEVVGMFTKNWNPVVYSCKQLQSISFTSCTKLNDVSLTSLVSKESSVESLSISTNSHITGLFLASNMATRLNSITLQNCFNLHGSTLLAAFSKIPNLRCLKLDQCPLSVWNVVPAILASQLKVEELSLTDFSFTANVSANHHDDLCEAFEKLAELKSLQLTRNVFVNDSLLKRIVKSCTKLQKLDISGCNSKPVVTNLGVSEEGLSAVGSCCSELRELNISYLARLGPAGVAALARCSQLRILTAHGSGNLTDAPLIHCLQSCHQLVELDVCGCEGVTEGVVAPCVAELQQRPRQMRLYLAATGAADNMSEVPTHSLLTVNVSDDRSVPHLRPDFDHHLLDDSDDSSLVLDEEDIEDFYSGEDDYDFDEDDYDQDELGFENALMQAEWGINPNFLFM